MMRVSEQHSKQSQECYEVVADGTVIYRGEDWAQIFREAALNLAYGDIVLLIDGKSGAHWSPPQSSLPRFPE